MSTASCAFVQSSAALTAASVFLLRHEDLCERILIRRVDDVGQRRRRILQFFSTGIGRQ